MEAHVKRCEACEALAGQPGDVDPHAELRGKQHFLRSDGVREVYTCRCGAKLERFISGRSLSSGNATGESGRWKTSKGR
jgi:hypothetical protein